jgi:hypothetical protein
MAMNRAEMRQIRHSGLSLIGQCRRCKEKKRDFSDKLGFCLIKLSEENATPSWPTTFVSMPGIRVPPLRSRSGDVFEARRRLPDLLGLRERAGLDEQIHDFQ